MTLSSKETTLLSDLKNQEQVCVEKYAKYSSEASDGQLKNLFDRIGQVEKQHLDTLNLISSGTVPQVPGSSPTQVPSFTSSSVDEAGRCKDKFLCSDVLATEKHASSLYDTCIFEFKDAGVRNVLNHLQKEEQGHGEMIYGYMSQTNMY